MEKQGGIRQPLLGVMSTIIVMFFSFGFIVWFNTGTFITWVSHIVMACVPISMIVAMVWQGNYPPPAAKLEQPLKGMYLLFFVMIIGSIVASWSNKTIGGYVEPPTPFVLFFTVLSVTTTLWLVMVWQCWPATTISKHPAFVGFGTLIFAYILVLVQYYVLLDFSFLKGAPFYKAFLDPGGVYNAWVALGFILTAIMAVLAFAEFDFWPFSAIAAKAPAFGKQPVWGTVVTVCVLIIAYIVRTIFAKGMGMDPTVYMLRVPLCVIFGEFIMLLLFQTAPVQTMKQPLKGFVLVIFNIIIAAVAYYLYAWFSTLIVGTLHSGPPDYTLEMWVTSALLGVTFPFITVYTSFFGFWPLSEPASKPDEM